MAVSWVTRYWITIKASITTRRPPDGRRNRMVRVALVLHAHSGITTRDFAAVVRSLTVREGMPAVDATTVPRVGPRLTTRATDLAFTATEDRAPLVLDACTDPRYADDALSFRQLADHFQLLEGLSTMVKRRDTDLIVRFPARSVATTATP
jgi:hypothetical protein